MKAQSYVIPADKAVDEQERVRSGFLFGYTRPCACPDLECRYRDPDLPCPLATTENPGKWLIAKL